MLAAIQKYYYPVACVIIAVIFTGFAVSWSSHYGKLSVPPDYDDSHSMVEGAIRLLNFQADGYQAAWDEYRYRNAHSFLHYYWPALLYSIFGIHQSVVYWANSLFLLGVILAFGSILPRINPFWKIVWIGAFLGLPVCFHLIHDFRSEVTMSALIFIGCAAAVSWAWETDRKGLNFSITALCFALALGMKPVMFPYTLGMLGLCSIVYLASCVFARLALFQKQDGTHCSAMKTDGGKIGIMTQSLAWVMALWFLVALPNIVHFYIYSRFIIGYIRSVAFGSDFYKLTDAQGASWAFHWLGYSGVWHLSVLNVFFVWIMGIGGICCVIPKLRQYAPDRKWLSLMFLTLGSFLGIAINSVHQPFFGMTFQLLLAASAITCVAHVFNRHIAFWIPIVFVLLFGFLYVNPALNRPIALPSLVIVLMLAASAYLLNLSKAQWIPFIFSGLVAMLCWQTTEIAPYHNYVQRTIAEAGESGLEWRRQGPFRVFEIIEKSLNDTAGSSNPIIWCANYGWVDGRTIAWEAVKRGKRWMVFTELELPKSLKTPFPPYADYFVIADSGVTGSIQTPYSSAITTNFSKMLDENKNMTLVGEIKDLKGNTIRIIKNNDPEKLLKQGADWPDWLLYKMNRKI